MVGCSFTGQSSLSNCGLGYVIGLMSSTLSGPCHIFLWASKLTREIARRSLGGEVYALSLMLGHAAMLREFNVHIPGFFPGLAGLEDCESLSTHLRNKKAFAGKFLARHFLAIQQAIDLRELGNANWSPGSGNPADGLTKQE